MLWHVCRGCWLYERCAQNCLNLSCTYDVRSPEKGGLDQGFSICGVVKLPIAKYP